MFPTVHAACLDAGIDPVTQPIPVVPAVHYHMGGVLVDANGRTTVDGLWAAGEVTSTGVHGANRLASNSLLEAVVFAARIAEDIKGLVPEAAPYKWGADAGENDELFTMEDSLQLKTLRSLMSAHAGVIRNREGLEHLMREIVRLERDNQRLRFHNITIAARLIAASAWRRHESRGGHYRSDFPESSDSWRQRAYLSLEDANKIVAEIAG
jgi:L-aspartate oxidase